MNKLLQNFNLAGTSLFLQILGVRAVIICSWLCSRITCAYCGEIAPRACIQQWEQQRPSHRLTTAANTPGQPAHEHPPFRVRV